MNKASLYIIVVLLISLATSCSKDHDSIILKPDAGSNFLDIENDGYMVQLDATAPATDQVGTWRIYVGQNGRFDDVNDPKTFFYGEPGEKYVLGWEVSEGGKYKSSSIDVSFKPLNPVILSIPQDTIYNNVSMYLEAEPAKYGAEGKWTIQAGNGGRLVAEDQAEAQFIGAENAPYVVRWTLSYGSKSVSKEITFVTDEFNAQAGHDNLDIKTAKEGYKFFSLEGFLPAGASGQWEIIKGQSGKVHSPELGTSLFEGVADTTYSLAWTIKLDQYESTDTVELRFRGKWGMFTDERDGQSYRFAELNGLEWMADNFNYVVAPGDSSWYYGHAARSIVEDGHPLETEEERNYYGRLYDWHAAYNNAPQGWRLPTWYEFDELLSSLGGGLYANDKILEGGDSGLDLIFAGYLNLSSSSDPAFRNVFGGQDASGLYWLNEISEYTGYANVFEVTASGEEPGVGPLPSAFFKLSVRYVRDIEE